MRRKRTKVAQTFAENLQPKINACVWKGRWMILLDFASRKTDNIIKEVYREDVGPDGHDYNHAYSRSKENPTKAVKD